MPYVSCMYAPPDPTGLVSEGDPGAKRITCIDEQGQTWWLTEDSQVGDWIEYVAAGGTVVAYKEPSPQ